MELLIKGSFWERVGDLPFEDLDYKSFILNSHNCYNLYRIEKVTNDYVYLKCYKRMDRQTGHTGHHYRPTFSENFRLVSLPTVETKRWASKIDEIDKNSEKDLLISGIVRKCINSKMNVEDCFYKIAKDYELTNKEILKSIQLFNDKGYEVKHPSL